MAEAMGVLYVVGIGPGAQEHATPAALAAIADAEMVVGYRTYIGLVQDLLVGLDAACPAQHLIVQP